MKTNDPNPFMLAACMAAAACITMAPAQAEKPTDEQRNGYVDSVYSWGSWELGLAPAAGPQAPQQQALNYREAGVQFRPNDNAEYRVPVEEIPVSGPIAPPAPTPMPTPVVDSTSLGPGDPIPNGGPLDGLF